jgi:hypothetical protein
MTTCHDYHCIAGRLSSSESSAAGAQFGTAEATGWVVMAGAVDTKTTILVLVLTGLFLATAMVAAYFTRSGWAVMAVVGGLAVVLTAVGLINLQVRARDVSVSLQGPPSNGGYGRRRRRLPWHR